MQLARHWHERTEIAEFTRVNGVPARFADACKCNSMHIMSNAICCSGEPERLPEAVFRLRDVARGLLPAHQQLGDGSQLHVGRAFVNLADLGVAPVFLHWIVFGEAVAAVDFDGERGDALGDL